jgi:flagellar motor switch protein FliN/FliY
MADDNGNLAAILEAEANALTEEAEEETEVSEEGAEAESEIEASSEEGEEGKSENIDLIMDIPLKVTVELGRTKMVVSELLNLGQGSVIELSKLAGEPMEVLVNDKLVARGEAVVVNEKFGIRLTDIISPTERVEQLK